MMSCLIALAFVCTSMLLITSCAKKQVKVSKAVEPTAEVVVVEKVKEGETEAERQARLRELEKAQRLAEEILAFESESIYFDFDKSELRNDSRNTLSELAQWMKNNPLVDIRIDGHCDERGSNEYNLALGETRAASAKKYLVYLGISPDRLETMSYGEEKPSCSEATESCWSKNRRDDFTITSK